MQQMLRIFEYENKREFRSLNIGGEIWFVAVDVCEILGLDNASQAIARLDDDERDTLISNEGIAKDARAQQLAIINEPGLYSLILTSRKPEAKAFKRWITHEVLPAIRKTGTYSLNPTPLPRFVVRYNENWKSVSDGMFSVLGEVYLRLYGRFEQEGYHLPDFSPDGAELRPDISVGQRFVTYLSNHHYEHVQSHSFYPHKLPNGKVVEARQYPRAIWHIFMKFLEEEWIGNCMEKYLLERDPNCLPYLQKILPPPKKPSLGGGRKNNA